MTSKSIILNQVKEILDAHASSSSDDAKHSSRVSSPSSHELESLKEFLGRDLFEKRYHRIHELVLRTQAVKAASPRREKLSGDLELTNRGDGLQGGAELALGTRQRPSNTGREAHPCPQILAQSADRAVNAARDDHQERVESPGSNDVTAADPGQENRRFQARGQSGYEDTAMGDDDDDDDAETRAKRVPLPVDSSQRHAKGTRVVVQSTSLQAFDDRNVFDSIARESPCDRDRPKPLVDESAKDSPHSLSDSYFDAEEKVATQGVSSSRKHKVAQANDKGEPTKTYLSSMNQKVSEVGAIILALDTAIQTGDAMERTQPTSIEHQLAMQACQALGKIAEELPPSFLTSENEKKAAVVNCRKEASSTEEKLTVLPLEVIGRKLPPWFRRHQHRKGIVCLECSKTYTAPFSPEIMKAVNQEILKVLFEQLQLESCTTLPGGEYEWLLPAKYRNADSLQIPKAHRSKLDSFVVSKKNREFYCVLPQEENRIYQYSVRSSLDYIEKSFSPNSESLNSIILRSESLCRIRRRKLMQFFRIPVSSALKQPHFLKDYVLQEQSLAQKSTAVPESAKKRALEQSSTSTNSQRK